MESTHGTSTEAPATVVQLPAPFLNDAGSIQNLLEEPCGSVAIIKSDANTFRACHYHKEDHHYLYVLSGRIHYYERPVGGLTDQFQGLPPLQCLPRVWGKYRIVYPGQMIFTPPMLEHLLHFVEPTEMISMSKLTR